MDLTLRYGRRGLPVTLPDRNVAHVLRLNHLPRLEDPRQAVANGLREPIGAEPLAELARGRRDAAIVISDLTRPVPNAAILPPLLDALTAAGIPPERILLLVATGLHRANTAEELAEMLGPDVIASGVRIEHHAARDADGHVGLGVSPRGIPVHVDRRYVEAELRILTGLVEPHLMAGYSGGRKAICPGLCGVETILAWHSPAMLDAPEACAGNLWRNPVHEEALAIADLAGGADLIVNAVLDEARHVTGVYCGDMRQAHLAGMAQAERQTKVVLPEPVDIVLTTSAGYPLDLTFYQGVKGMLAALPILKPGGTLIIAQENAEGIGGPEFTELILGEPDLEHFMARAFRGDICVIDQWQLQEMHKAACRVRLLNYGTGIPAEVQRDLFVEPIASVEAGVQQAVHHHGPDATIAVIPEGPYVLACLAGDLVGRQTVREMV